MQISSLGYIYIYVLPTIDDYCTIFESPYGRDNL